jgi:hypothetical protein
MPRARTLATLFLAVSAACSKLPDYAAPRSGGAVDAVTLESKDLIAYRVLSREDFKRREPPGEVRHGAHELMAMTCGFLFTEPNTKVRVEETRFPDGVVRYDASVPALKLLARMDRECSWWNTEPGTTMSEEYVLEHEQIHFAIYELQARYANQAWAESGDKLGVSAETREEVTESIREKLKEFVQEHVEAALDRSREFDEDTSLGYQPERQKEWWRRVNQELQQTEAWR